MSLSDLPCFKMLSETPIFYSRQSISRYVGKPPSSFKNLLHALPIYRFELFSSHICKQATCQQSPFLCLEGIDFSNKVLLLGTLYSAVHFLFLPQNKLLLLHFHHYFLLHHLLPILLHFLLLLSTIISSSSSVSLSNSSIFLRLAFSTFWRSLYFFRSVFFHSFFSFSFSFASISSNKSVLLIN